MKIRRVLIIAIATACTLGVVQALVETLVIAGLYRNYLLPPATFFNIRIYDAYLKIYSHLAEVAHLPAPLNTFAGQGFGAKLAIVRDLVWVNVAVGVLLGLAVGAIAAAVVRRRATDGRRLATGIVIALVAVEAVVHVAAWLTELHLPTNPAMLAAARNIARNFVFDGTALALTVLALCLPAARLLVRAMEARVLIAAAATAAVAAGAWAFTSAPTAHAIAAMQPPRSAPEAAARGYNVVLISIDSLRADHLGAYGYGKPTSPTIDALAAGGVLFRRTSSTTAWTLPGHMSMLTGRSLLGHGVVSDDRKLTDDVALIQESYRAAGYTTGAIVSAPYLESRYGFARGFDSYDDKTINFATHGESYKHVTAPLVLETTRKWLDANSKNKFFLFLHFWDVHYDYAPGAPYDRMFDPGYTGSITGDNFYFNAAVNRKMDPRDLAHVLALYDGEIRLVDDHLAKLRAALEAAGVAQNTIIVVTADHGDEFFEHGRKGHHRTLYDEILRVPFVLYVPGVRPAAPVVDMETSIVDVMPTLLGVTGLSVPAGVEGMDLSGVALRGDATGDRSTFSELYRKDALNVQTSLRHTGKKVIHHFNRRIVEAYDVDADPAETKTLENGRGFGAAMLAQMKDLLNSLWPVYYGRIATSGVADLPMDADTRERLRSLGYIQ